jgi:Zn-dependent protease
MIFAEPGETRWDLRFRLGSIPVRVRPFFWLGTLLLAGLGPLEPMGIALWVLAVFVSILVHELGHALAFRYYGSQPRIVLHGMGGLAAAESGYGAQSHRSSIVISAAGPGAQLLLAALIAGGLFAAGYQSPLFGAVIGRGEPIPNHLLAIFVFDLLVINVGWALVNLLPVHPLDGGQIARDLFEMRDADQGLRRSLWLSAFAGFAAGVIGLWLGSLYIGILFFYLGAMNVLVLRQFGDLVTYPGQRAVRWLARAGRRSQQKRQRAFAERQAKKEARIDEHLEPHDADVSRVAQDLLSDLTSQIRKERAAQRDKPQRDPESQD